MKDIDNYANWTSSTWVSSGDPQEIAICALGLAGETGEAIEHIKKRLRDGTWNEEAFKKEMGDQIYYWARLLVILGISPSDVLQMNIDKLEDRMKRKQLQGSGDNR